MLIHPDFDPVAIAIGPLAIRWYGLMYLTAFAAFWWLGTRRIAGFDSEVLVLGAMPSATEVVLLSPDQRVENGTRIG